MSTALASQAQPTSRLWHWLMRAAGALRPAAPPEDDARREAARQAGAVRDLADRYRRTDPGFASDLYAAADRYERSFDRVG